MRSFASGVMTTGMSCGIFIWPPFFRFLIDTYTWRGAFYIISGVVMQTFILICLMRQPPQVSKNDDYDKVSDKDIDIYHVDIDSVKASDDVTKTEDDTNVKKASDKVVKTDDDNNDFKTTSDKVTTNEDDTDKVTKTDNETDFMKTSDKIAKNYDESDFNTASDKVIKAVDFQKVSEKNIKTNDNGVDSHKVLDDNIKIANKDADGHVIVYKFDKIGPNGTDNGIAKHADTVTPSKRMQYLIWVLYTICLVLQFVGHFVPMSYYPMKGKQDGISKDKIPILLSVIGGMGIISRPTTGYITDRFVNRISLAAVSLIICGAVLIASTFLHTFVPLLIICLSVGIIQCECS